MYAPFAGKWKNGDQAISISASGRGFGALVFKAGGEDVVSISSFKIAQDAKDKTMYISIPVGIKRSTFLLSASADGLSLTMEALDGPAMGKTVYTKAK